MPVDRGAIDGQLRDIGEGERWWEVREFRDLPYILHPGERIHGISRGNLLGSPRPRVVPAAMWLIVVTNERLLCLRQERFGRKQVEIGPGQITAIRQKSRLRSHQITIETPLRKYRLRVPKESAFRFMGALTPLLPDAPLQPVNPDLRALSWIPGINSVATLPGFAGVISRVSQLSPPEYASRHQVAALESAVERLQDDLERLHQQVQFLENLLQTRADEALPRRIPERS